MISLPRWINLGVLGILSVIVGLAVTRWPYSHHPLSIPLALLLAVLLWVLTQVRIASFDTKGQGGVAVALEYAPIFLLMWLISPVTILLAIVMMTVLDAGYQILGAYLLTQPRWRPLSIKALSFIEKNPERMETLWAHQRWPVLLITVARKILSTVFIVIIFSLEHLRHPVFAHHIPLWSLAETGRIFLIIFVLTIGLSLFDLWSMSWGMDFYAWRHVITQRFFLYVTSVNIVAEWLLWFIGITMVVIAGFTGFIAWMVIVIVTSWLLKRRLTQIELEQRLQFEKEAASTDFLTGLPIRRPLEEYLATLQTEKISVLVGMIDADLFKSVNDRYGHDVGDQVLKQLGHYWAQHCRMQGQLYPDMIARWGGEEFVLVCPELSLFNGLPRLKEIHQALGQTPIVSEPAITLTCSVGLTVWDSSTESFEEALKRADEGMYQAKKRGRNRIIVQLKEGNSPDPTLDSSINLSESSPHEKLTQSTS